MMLEISRSVLDAIVAEAELSPGVEVCGLLFGADDRVVTMLPAANVADDPTTGFEIDPQRLFAAQRAARDGGPAVIGHYHSHPNGRATPSPRDAASAHGGELWVIVAGGMARAWRAAHGGGFDELTIIIE